VGCGSTTSVPLTPVGSRTSSAVAACFRAAGAWATTKPAGPGTAVYAFARDGAAMGFVKAPDASAIKGIGKVWTHGGSHITMLRNDPTAFIFYNPRTSPTSVDLDLLTKCSTRPSFGSTAGSSSSAGS